MEVLRSQQNSLIKQTVKLQTAKGRKVQGAYLLEGEHTIEEAIQSGVELSRLFVSESAMPRYQEWLTRYDATVVSDTLFAKLSMTESQQGVLAVVPIEKNIATQLPKGRYLLVDAVQDPGNLGTMIRTADAAGFDGVVLGEGCVDLYNDKVIRSMQGSQFHIPIYRAILDKLIPTLQAAAIPVAVTALHHTAVSHDWLTGLESVAIVVGNEGNGVRQDVIDLASQVIKIPMYGQAESLNVAIASAILMYQTRM